MNARLFVVTMNRVLSYQASGGSGGSATVVDEVGSGLGCATTDWQNSDIVVARDEAIYIRGIDGRGACYALNLKVSLSPCLPSPFLPSDVILWQATKHLCTHTRTTFSSYRHLSFPVLQRPLRLCGT